MMLIKHYYNDSNKALLEWFCILAISCSHDFKDTFTISFFGVNLWIFLFGSFYWNFLIVFYVSCFMFYVSCVLITFPPKTSASCQHWVWCHSEFIRYSFSPQDIIHFNNLPRNNDCIARQQSRKLLI